MSHIERARWESDLKVAGWTLVDGWWTHANVPGTHNIVSAMGILTLALS